MAKVVAGWTWFFDEDLVAREVNVIEYLAALDEEAPRLADLVVKFPWIEDGILKEEASAVGYLYELALHQGMADLAVELATLPWILDGVTVAEAEYGLGALRGLAIGGEIGTTIDESEAIDLARRIAGLSWVTDGITEGEWEGMWFLWGLARFDIEFAKEIVDQSWVTDVRTLSRQVRVSLERLGFEEMALSKLGNQPWFADGLNDAEAALVTTLYSVAGRIQTGYNNYRRIPELYDDLLENHHIQHKTVSLPLAGDVNIWVIESATPPAEEDLLTVIAETARIVEGLLGIPFPTTDIILLVLPSGHGIRGSHMKTHMMLIRHAGKDVPVPFIPHETAHYYFELGPLWFREGGAQFIEGYINDQMGVEDLADRRVWVSEKAQSLCFELNRIENIRHSAYVGGGGESCPYLMGEHFLFNLFDVVGEKAMTSALGELLQKPGPATEDDIYHAVLRHAPPDRKEAFKDLYRRLHGGAAAFPEPDFSGDHGDEPMTASDLGFGEAVNGMLDYMFDFDYFRFQASDGQRYRISTIHETLRYSSVRIYDAGGKRAWGWQRHWEVRDRIPYGVEVSWTAPSSGEYYLAVQNFGGKSGPYTVLIVPIEAVSDDHSDSAPTATDISVGETVDGVIDYDFDLDFFEVEVGAGKDYQLRIDCVTMPFCAVRQYESDGVTRGRHSATGVLGTGTTLSGSPTIGNSTSEFVAPSSGVYYLAVDGPYGSVGSYRFSISELDTG